MSYKNYSGPIRTDRTVTVIHGKSVPKKNEIGGEVPKKGDMSVVIHNAKIENGEIGLTRISREFAQALIDGRKTLNTEDKSFTQKDLATKSGVPLQIIQGYEKVDTIVDNQFQSYCNKIKKALGITVLPKLVVPKLKPDE
jgi:ribosome-binding protein aMBF1 (putative translation factor)